MRIGDSGIHDRMRVPGSASEDIFSSQSKMNPLPPEIQAVQAKLESLLTVMSKSIGNLGSDFSNFYNQAITLKGELELQLKNSELPHDSEPYKKVKEAIGQLQGVLDAFEKVPHVSFFKQIMVGELRRACQTLRIID